MSATKSCDEPIKATGQLTKPVLIKLVVLSILFLITIIATYSFKPKKYLSEISPIGDITKIIPEEFGSWRTDQSASNVVVNATVQESLFGIYSQLVSRTYINNNGYRIMLSVSYGGDQSRELQVHRPEVCYAAGGFVINQSKKVQVNTPIGGIPAMQLTAVLGDREEPVTYWVRIGEKIVRGNIEQGLARAEYSFKGYIADGLLFRVSSIDHDPENAFLMQESFVQELVPQIPIENRYAIFGNVKK